MDFTTLDLGPAAASRTETAATITPLVDGAPIPLKGGKTLQLTLALPNTPEGQREVRKWSVRHKTDEPAADASEADLDAWADRQMAAEAELAARVVRDWNLVDKAGKPVECSLENRKAFFAHFHAIRADTIMQMSAQVEALGKSRNA